jgi:putative NIF3 family GTP cyclohydrolase 1 type 2
MQRRDFLQNMSLFGIGTLGGFDFEVKENMTAQDLQNYLRSLIEVNEPSTDRIVIGDPNTIIKKIGTCWMPHWELCKEAVAKGINVLVAHEPTFYTHWDLQAKDSDYLKAQSDVAKQAYIEQRDKKAKWIRENGLVIIRSHDVMDKLGEIGMPFALGQAMGFTNKEIIRSQNYYNVYGIQPQSAIEFVKKTAKLLKKAGNQPGVGFYGDKNRLINSVGVGCGYLCDPLIFSDQKPDLFVVINDTIKTWIQGSYSMDSGQPMMVIDHGTSEEFGMRLLQKHLSERWKNHECIHFARGCTYEWVSG